MSSAVYYDYASRLIRSMLKFPDSGPFQSQSQPQPQTGYCNRDNIQNTWQYSRYNHEEKIVQLIR